MKSNVNLHIHTVFSDGAKSVAEIVNTLKKNDVKFFSITDHDAVNGNIEAILLARENKMQFVNGIELTCCFSGELNFERNTKAHILGYKIDIEKMQLQLDRNETIKKHKIKELIKKLLADGYKINSKILADIQSIASDAVMLLIAKDLHVNGYSFSVAESFTKILDKPEYIEYSYSGLTIKEGIKVIIDCGGIPCWAHPFTLIRRGKITITDNEVLQLVHIMKDYGLQGIEVYYYQYSPAIIQYLGELADRNDLLKTIGTDYHGKDISEIFFREGIDNLAFAAFQKTDSIVFDVEKVKIEGSIVEKLFL